VREAWRPAANTGERKEIGGRVCYDLRAHDLPLGRLLGLGD